MHGLNYSIYNLCVGCHFQGDTMRQRIKFTDERVCKSHLLDSCPHDILSGTVSITFFSAYSAFFSLLLFAYYILKNINSK